jgi:O-antigen/teichoic acid export membrane protein
MPDHLKNKTIAALFWSFFERIGHQVIQFVISITLARLLLPEEFGLVAMLTVFIAVAVAFVHGGFGQALIQKQNAHLVDESSVFYFNILIAILLYGLLYLAAPFISEFYDMPILTSLTRVLSFNIIIGSFAKVQNALMNKNLAFKELMIVTFIATIISGTVGITMAYSGFGVWSLAAHSIANQLITAILLWVIFPWRPAWIFSFTSLKSMFPFGSRILLTNLLWVLMDNIYIIAIGKIFSASDLGFYSRAYKFTQLAVGNLTRTVERVTYPAYSSIQNDKTRLKRGMRKSLSSLSMIIFPLLIGMALVAEPLVLVLLTEKWLPCVPFLQLMCIATIFRHLQAINLNILKALGRSDLFFNLHLMKTFMIIGSLFITYRWGIKAIIFGQIAIAVVSYFVINYFTYKIVNYSIYEQIKDVFPYLSISCLMGACAFALQFIEFTNVIYLLTYQVVISIIIYVALNVIFKTNAFFEIYGIFVRGVETWKRENLIKG